MKDSTISPPVQVTALDADGHVMTNFTGTVTVAIGENGGVLQQGKLSGSNQVAAVGGVTTFDDLSIDQVGKGYTLTSTASPFEGDTSAAFDITATPPAGPGPATKLLFVGQPTNTAPGATISPPVRVEALDDQNNLVTSFGGTISIRIEHDGSLLAGANLNGTKDVPAVHGVAIFANLSINELSVTYYTLLASSAQLGASIESGHFTVP